MIAEAETWVAHLRAALVEPGLETARRDKLEEVLAIMLQVRDQLRDASSR
jgi:hypothetical protein